MPRVVDVAPRTPSGEEGFTLVELLVAMSLLAILMSAAVVGISSTLDMTRNDRQRSVAADLAAQEMDTVRNSDFTTLASGTITKTQTVDGAVYTIKRFSSWISASATTGPCDGPTASVAYLRVTVRVSWNQMKGVQPVRSQTVVAPPVGAYDPNTGGIAVKVLNRDALPAQGATVTITGPSGTSTQSTTEDGCAFFAFVQAGSYTVTLNNAGFVNGQGIASPSATATVAVGTTTAVQFDYDQAATINATMQGVDGSAPPAVALSLGNSHLVPVGTMAVAGSGVSRTNTNLFPYADGYQLWAGDCADADPLGTTSSGVRYYPTANRSAPVAVTPGAASSATVTTSTLAITLTRSNGVTPVVGATVKAVHAADTRCGSGETITLGVTSATGTLNVAMPFGTWNIQVTGQTPFPSWPSISIAPPASLVPLLVKVV